MRVNQTRLPALVAVAAVAAVCLLAAQSWYERRRQGVVIGELRTEVAQLSGSRHGPSEGGGSSADRREQLERAFASDATGDVPEELRQAMNERIATTLRKGSALLSLECKVSMCRIETSHRDRMGYEVFIQAAFLRSAHTVFSGPSFSVPLGDAPAQDGSLVGVTFLAREGRSLPPAS
jgi:hypothetical protein